MTEVKLVNRRWQACEELLAYGRVSLGRALEEGGADLGAEWREQARQVVATVLAKLESDRDELTQASNLLNLERRESVASTTARDQAAAELRALLIGLRRAWLGLFGETFVALVGLESATPATPRGLWRQASAVLQNVATTEVPAGPLGAGLDPVAMARPLFEPTNRLARLMPEASGEAAESNLAQVRKDRAVRQFDRTFDLAASLLVTFHRHAGDRKAARELARLKRWARGKVTRRHGGDAESGPDEAAG